MHGAKLGRALGFPTANVRLRQPPPFTGIFAVRVHGLGEGPREGVASLGVRPTVAHGGEPVLEVYLFDFDGEIYGRRIARGVPAQDSRRGALSGPPLAHAPDPRDVARAREYFAAPTQAATTPGTALPAGH